MTECQSERTTKSFIIKDTIPCYVAYIYRVEAANEDDALQEYYNSNATPIGKEVGETIGWLDHGDVSVEEEKP